MTDIKMRTYTEKEHELWVNEVKEIYQKVKSHSTSYVIDFLGSPLTVCPNVFSPKYFNNTKWYAERLLNIIGNGSLLEIGTGTGAIAIICAKGGANVVATDINKDAVKCAIHNIKKHELPIIVLQGDVYECISDNLKFDYIFWNHPYNNSTRNIDDELLIAGFDYNYNSLRKYISEAYKYLKNPNVGLLVGTGGQADIKSIHKIANENNYELKLLFFTEKPLSEGAKAPNDFRIYSLNRKNMDKDDLWKLYTSINEWIKVADSKALFSLGIISLMATMLGIFISKDLLSFFKSDFSSITFISFIGYVIVTMISSILVIFPVIKTKFNDNKSILFFMDIANNPSPEAYSDVVEKSNRIELELKNQIYINSNIAKRKYTVLKWSISFLIISIFTLIILFITSI